MDMTVRELIQDLLLNGNLDDEIAINDPKDPYVITVKIAVIDRVNGRTYISVKEGE